MIDPNIIRCLNGDGITIVGKDFGDFQVPDDDVGLLVDGEANAREAWISQA